MSTLTILSPRSTHIISHSLLRQTTPLLLRGHFSTTPVSTKDKKHTSWNLPNLIYSKDEIESVSICHHEAKTLSDKLARGLVSTARWGFDVVTRYKHASPEDALESLKAQGKTYESMSLQQLRDEGFVMTEKQWMSRILFLESIAAVPGMVAVSCESRFLLVRNMLIDGLMRIAAAYFCIASTNTIMGLMFFILIKLCCDYSTFYKLGCSLSREEAENERMHLMTFLQIRKPSLFMRLAVLGAQGVFYNMFFLAYLISAKAAHRFVGYLEEEACLTYTQVINEIDRKHIPEWDSVKVPPMAISYWKMAPDSTMRDLILMVRADEASHRFYNHTFANLNQNDDSSPFRMRDVDNLEVMTQAGWTRDRSLEWNKKIEAILHENESCNEADKAEISTSDLDEISKDIDVQAKKKWDNKLTF